MFESHDHSRMPSFPPPASGGAYLIDAGWGEALQDVHQGGLKAFLARRIAIEHGGTLARFATSDVTTYVMVLPRRAPEDLDHEPTA
jgi:hypothetical protein